MGEQVHRELPAVAGSTEHPVARDDHVVEEHLGELVDAVHGAQRPDGDPRGVHVDEERRDPGVARRGTGEQHAPGGVLGEAGPHLLAADHPGVAPGNRPGGEGCEVAAGTGL
jgi:hypothetical protein